MTELFKGGGVPCLSQRCYRVSFTNETRNCLLLSNHLFEYLSDPNQPIFTLLVSLDVMIALRVKS